MLGARDYLRVDDFLRTEIEARALALALEWGLIERLERGGACPADALLAGRPGPVPAPGRDLLLALLRSNRVVGEGEPVALTPAFREALRFRDLLEAKLAFAALVAGDVHGLLPQLVADLPGFMARSNTFALFRYDRCLDVNPANLAAARRWVGYTTALTRHEAGPCWEAIGPAGHGRLLDIGGNSGEFARQACAQAPGLAATVFDLPVVCALGREHLAGSPQAARVRFVAGDMRRDALPEGHDLVTFKSVLHDWPAEEAGRILAAAAAALAPGGRLVIVERAPLVFDGFAPTYAMVANLVFLHFLRPPDLYREVLARAGLEVAPTRHVALETPFQVVDARKPARCPP